jgi:exonuclease SbcD
MKIVHTADWHLGRQFHNVSLLEDQRHALEQIVSLAGESQADVVIVAGDVFDRSVPPAEAVQLLDDTLHRLKKEADCAVVMIAGNHDGAVRLAHGSREMESSGVYISGPLAKSLEPIVIEDKHGPVHFCVLPYADPAEVRLAFGDDDVRSHEHAISAMVEQMLSHVPDVARTVAVGHCWVEGGANSESERPLTVGGTGEVGAGCFEGFHYTALGHLHRPQKVNHQIRYSGSILKYSFSEISHRKSINLVELDGDGEVNVEQLEITPRREVRLIEGFLEEVIDQASEDLRPDDYLLVRLSDEGAILDAMGQLRSVYPNTLHIERPGLQIHEGEMKGARDHRRRSELDLFKDFYRQMRDQDLSAEQEQVIQEVVEEIRRGDREVSA